MRPQRIAAVLAGALVVALGAAIPAHAQSRVFHDEIGDAQTGIDVTKVRVVNNRRLVLISHHVDLPRRTGAGYFIDIDRTRPGPEFVLGGGLVDSDFNIFHARRWRSTGEPIGCDLRLRPRFARDQIKFSMARACLDGTRKHVRVSFSVAPFDGDDRDFLPGRREFTRWVPFGR